MNNTTIVLIFSTILLSLPNIQEWKLLVSLLAVTIAASCAFMTPIATTTNMLVYASSEHRSLKMMLKKGFWLNIIGSIFLTAFLWLLSFFFRN
jgi:sodium-dependent dicarboxylate transporter 2/3/5